MKEFILNLGKWIVQKELDLIYFLEQRNPKRRFKKRKFKIGEKVKYNWKAKCMLRNHANNEKHVAKRYTNKINENIEFETGSSSGGSVYWYRKIYFWE